MPHSIIIIDDDTQILKLLSQFLGQGLGYAVATAEDGKSAIDAAMKQSFDLAIIDVHLPDQSGTDTYTRLKNINPQIEAIFFTGDYEFEQGMDFLKFALPKERVVRKPMTDFSALTRLIIGILGPPH